ncbi:MAG: APC family permease [Acidobacteriia bacterium]|nr:APC family permease [Terriglobia bacterium]
MPAKTATSPLPRVVVATTAMLSFISFWRVAAIVLSDLGSSAYYAGGIAEQAVGKAAPWFIFAIMLFSYAVRSTYIESCSMFVRGGVYPVIKKAMGGTVAKVAVSALLFDFVLTGPISAVSAGHYLVGFVNDLFRYGHLGIVLPANFVAAAFAVVATLYFWWQNVKGISTSSQKALRIMQLTTVMVVLLMAWCGLTLWLRGGHLPPWPRPANLHFAPDALGWLRGTGLAQSFGLLGILIALGHSVLAMSGEETLAQTYREIEHPKLLNLKKAAFLIFIYSLILTSLVSFFAVMIIPDTARKDFLDNLIGGLAMHVVGPLQLRLVFHAFVVLVGVLILSGAVNTAIVGSNGVLNRVSEDGVLAAWFRQPHQRFGTSYRIINIIASLQIVAIVLSRGDVFLLGEAYAFGVIWSFTMEALAVLVLRYRYPVRREYRVPLNLDWGRIHIPVGLGLITLSLLAIAIVNLFTKSMATVMGLTFTAVFFALFTASERITRWRAAAHEDLDQFHLAGAEELTNQAVGARPGNVLVMIHNYRRLDHLESVLERVRPEHHDIVALQIRVLEAGASGDRGIIPEQLFTANEQVLFTRVLALAEKHGKTIHLALMAANRLWDGMVRAAQSLQSAMIVVGPSVTMSPREEARRAGLAWERLPTPKRRAIFEVFIPPAQREVFYLGPHTPHLTPKEIDVLHRLWLRFSDEVGPEDLHHHDVVHFALAEIERELAAGKETEIIEKLKRHLQEIRDRRARRP